LSVSFEQLLAGAECISADDFADARARALRGMEAVEGGKYDLALEALGWCCAFLSAAEGAWRRGAAAGPDQESALVDLRAERDPLAVRLQRTQAAALRLVARVMELERVLELDREAHRDDAQRAQS
jgi:hypothetical protein